MFTNSVLESGDRMECLLGLKSFNFFEEQTCYFIKNYPTALLHYRLLFEDRRFALGTLPFRHICIIILNTVLKIIRGPCDQME